ncbi:UvrD-helicase domain-containing protein [Mesorhizobium sp. ESP7-2]|uniref:UvrD-helicase domain-containing protein n=1 Tax=Mesorhizobium sp. ESP7-2 TaxID=2876622 RepID=UPI001CCE0C5A|nr:UvrD-helicase domain-containing protein [Mesorhizobium sp. ESP7-2]MBZ9711159.1 UvrD-helicase domain-containing protein [Mesorhizobium sp. ESP7-2]
MLTILADSFTASLTKLTNDEQKQAQLTAYTLMTEPDRPGLQFHRIDKAKDPNFWSVRVTRDIRIIVHKTGGSLMLAYVDHHDDAYKWAERRRIEAHPVTGAIQIVEVRERIEEITSPLAAAQTEMTFDVPPPAAAPLIFERLGADQILSVGVPEDWIADVEKATEESFFALAGHLPQEAAEALLEYAATGILPPPAPPVANPLAHPDTMRRFRILDGIEELQAALDAPFEKWVVFLHPLQRQVVERDYSGPVRVAGSAGTGKTVVALHRIMRMLRTEPEARVLLTTFSDPLAESLQRKLGILAGGQHSLTDQVTVASFRRIAEELYALTTGRTAHVADRDTVRKLVEMAAHDAGVTGFSPRFLLSEWENVVDAWHIEGADAYADVPRMGRKNRLGQKQRETLWQVFSRVREGLRQRALFTPGALFQHVTATYAAREEKPFSHIVVDEAQDLGVAELRFLAAIAPAKPEALFFAGDVGQRIFQQPFSWLGLGIDVRGRSFTLKVNYRTSQQIRQMADRLLPRTIRDVDGLEDDRRGTVSVFDGIEPEVVIAHDEAAEREAAATFIRSALDDGIAPREIAIFVRSPEQLPRARAIAEAAELPFRTATTRRQDEESALVGIMHLAKGLEFRAVAVVACDEGVLPLASRVADVADEYELDEVIATERQLLYVAATRARDRLFVSGIGPSSEFLDDLFRRLD